MVSLLVPTYNAASTFPEFLEALRRQTLKPELLLLDLQSTDETVDLARESGFNILSVVSNAANRCGIRQLGFEECGDSDILVFMTPDAIFASVYSLEMLVNCFDDRKVGAACGRQLPFPYSSILTRHQRRFHYPSISSVKAPSDIALHGIRTAFMSNSFAAYRKAALEDIGGFRPNVVCGEGTIAVAKLLQKGWKTAYCAEAVCFHSHDHTVSEELRHYFDIGVLHSKEPWFIRSLGKDSVLGKGFFVSQMSELFVFAPFKIPVALFRNLVKIIAYHLGKQQEKLPVWLSRSLSLNKDYWNLKEK